MNDVIRKDDDRQQVVVRDQGPTMLEIFAAAVDKGIDIEKMRELRDMVEWHDKREAEKAFNRAMPLFRQESIPIIKNRHVSFSTSKGVTAYDHATLDHIVELASPVLGKHGFSYNWRRIKHESSTKLIEIECTITHEQGHSISTSLDGYPDESGGKNHIQSVISTVSYLERVTFLMLTGLAAKGQDNDGAGAAVNGNGNAMPAAITESQVKELDKLIKATGTSLDSFLAWTKAGSLQALPPARFKDAHEMLLRRKQLQEEKAKKEAAQ